MLPEILAAYKSGRLMLLLGAGASAHSRDSTGVDMPLGNELAEEIAALKGWPYHGEPLSSTYSAANAIDPAGLQEYLRNRLTNTRPSSTLKALVSFPWSRIYTLNVDDCTEVAFRQDRTQKLSIFGRNSPLADPDPIFGTVQLIKLNGSADRPEDGFIFSPQEYGEGSSRLPIWYRELGQNYSSNTFVFIGSKLDEPLFQHAIAQMRSMVKRSPQRGYVITPSATPIETHHLSSLNLIHIPGTLQDFVDWLSRKMPNRPTTWDLATGRRPELKKIAGKLSDGQRRALNSVTLVSADTLPRLDIDPSLGPIRAFYKGYKPTWQDILDEIPAELACVNDFSTLVRDKYEAQKCIALVGPAGSGKTTALMIAALNLSKATTHPIYFLREAVSDLKEVVIALEQINDGPFYLFIDKIESMQTEIAEVLNSASTKNICVIASERLNIWNRRVKAVVAPFTAETFTMARIRKSDAVQILAKLEKFGPWTRLQPMRPDQRVEEVFKKADRQLLIGLMEATTGVGFKEIIASDFRKLGDDHHKQFLVIIGLASIHRASLSARIVGSALSNLGIAQDVNVMARETEGVVITTAGKYVARHAVYVRELFERIVPVAMIRDCLIAVLEAFADYETPVIKNVAKADGVVFRNIINHRFIHEMMRGDENEVRSIYKTFETRFHTDGLYWLQYGLALRDFGHDDEAMEKLRTARDAYSSPQIEHAYAQQLLIIASKASSWDEAERLLREATTALRDLERTAVDGDTYPIVTLAEGHISIMLQFFGTEGTKDIAQRYANELLIAQKKQGSARLDEAVKKVMTLATTGVWSESYGPNDSDNDL